MGNPKPLPAYWDKILINASQVTNSPIDPFRKPMETKVFLGKKPEKITRGKVGKLQCDLSPQIELSMPVMFSEMLSAQQKMLCLIKSDCQITLSCLRKG